MHKSVAQFGEDMRVIDFFGHDHPGFFVEVGANDPIQLSQTYLLEQMGWRGVLIEPIASLAKKLREKRPGSLVVEAAVSDPDHTGTAYLDIPNGDAYLARLVFSNDELHGRPSVQVRTLNSILDEAHITTIDFLSIDIEGHELPALRGFSFDRFRPRLIIIEDRVHNLSLHRFLTRNGYRLVDRIGCNGWYLRQDIKWTIRSHSSWFVRLRKYYIGLPLRMLRHSKITQHCCPK